MFLQSMREKTQSIFAYIIIGLLILSFALWGISSYLNDGFGNNTIAKVNGEKIFFQDYTQALNQYNQTQQMRLGAKYNPTPEQQNFIKQVVLDNMISHMAISQYVANAGFNLDRSQVDSALFSLPAFQIENEFSPEIFKRYLQSQGLTASAFFGNFANSLAISQWQQGISNTTFVTKPELDNQIELLQQKRSVVYSIVDLPTKSHADTSDKMIEQYYQQHQKEFVTPEEVKISYVEVSLSDLVRRIKPTQEQLESYYRKNISKYSGSEQWKVNIYTVNDTDKSLGKDKLLNIAEQVSKNLGNNESIDKIISDNNGAEIKLAQENMWLSATNLSVNSKDLLSNMKSKGQVTEPVSIEGGFVIYQIRDYKPAMQISFNEAKSDVKKAYVQEKAAAEYSAIAEKMTNVAYEQPESLRAVSEAAQEPIQTSGYFAKIIDNASNNDVLNKQAITSDEKIISAAFSDDVLLGNNNSDLIKLDGNKIVVLRIVGHKPSQEKPLSDVTQQIKAVLEKEAATKKVADKAMKIKNALIADNYTKVGEKFGVKFIVENNIGRFSKLSSDGVLQQAFSLGKNEVGIVALEDGSVVVVKVLNISAGKISSISDKDKIMYQNMLLTEWSNATMSVYADGVIKAAKVKSNIKALDQI